MIYADSGLRSRLSTRGVYLRGRKHQLGVPLRGLQFGGVIFGRLSSEGIISAHLQQNHVSNDKSYKS